MADYDISLNNITNIDVDIISPTIKVNTEETQKIVDVTVEPKEYYIDASFKDIENLNVDFAEFITSKSRSSSVFVVTQEDITDLAEATKALGTSVFHEGDMLVITNAAKTENAGYVYTGTLEWVAFSGNVFADNVLFSSDITCAGDYSQVGNVTKEQDGVTTIAAKGKTLTEVMKNIFTKEVQPTKINPTIYVTLVGAGAYEVGTTFSPSYTSSFNSGSYTFGPDTNVSALKYNFSSSSKENMTTINGTFNSFIVEDDTDYYIKGEVTYSAGENALTNLGSVSSPLIKITAGTASGMSSHVTGYRKIFYKLFDSLEDIDSNLVRSSEDCGQAIPQSLTISVGKSDMKKICIFIPDNSGLQIVSVISKNGLNLDITSQYKLSSTVLVDGCNNVGLLTKYNIWTYQPASIDKNEIHEVVIG